MSFMQIQEERIKIRVHEHLHYKTLLTSLSEKPLLSSHEVCLQVHITRNFNSIRFHRAYFN